MKTTLNVLLLSAIFAVPMATSAAVGNTPAPTPAPKADDAAQLEKIKAVKQQGLDARLKVLQDEKACVQAATNKEALHSCEKAANQAMDKIKEQQKANWAALKGDKAKDNAPKKK